MAIVSRRLGHAESRFLLELLNLGLHLLPEGLLGRLLARVDEDRNYFLDSRDINAGTLGLPALAIGNRPVNDLGLVSALPTDVCRLSHEAGAACRRFSRSPQCLAPLAASFIFASA